MIELFKTVISNKQKTK